MRLIGVDPGLSGAISLIENGRLVWVHEMPVVPIMVNQRRKNRLAPGLVAEIISSAGDVHKAYIEEVHAMPKQGVSSSFNFGMSYGVVMGVLAALRVPTEPIRPPAWRKLAGVRGDKSASRYRATELFPGHAKHFAKKKDDGKAEAVLIAYAGRRMEAGV